MRINGWEGRLWAIIEDARQRPYSLGEHDCFRLACRVVEALTGVDRWPEFAGYRTKREAMAKLAEHGANFEEAGDWFFGGKRMDVKLACRGDIAAIATVDGEKHLGVCVGDKLACLGPDGLAMIPLRAGTCAWKVG